MRGYVEAMEKLQYQGNSSPTPEQVVEGMKASITMSDERADEIKDRMRDENDEEEAD